MGKETISRTTFVKGVTACVVVAASLGIIQIGEYSIDSGQTASEATTASSTSGSASYTPGTYTASAAGISSDVTVSCTFDESSITSITVDVSGETDGIGADIGDEMIDQFLTAQGSSVDGVSGATITSDALKTALEDCISQAAGGSDDSEDAAAEDETEGVSEAESEVAEDASESAEEISTEAESAESTVSSSTDSYTPGTYSATAAGISSDVTVTITVDETSILSITCDVSGETAGIGADIGDEITEQILDAQSADVDGVSGATITSDAVMTATADALAQASDGASGTEEAAEADTEADSEVSTEADTEEEADSEAADTEADTEEEATESTVSSGTGSYTPGTYSATAAGISSDVTVTITVDETSIQSVTCDVSGETAGIGADIGDEISEQILDAQSADVDGVSGATITSDAVITATADALAQAADGASDAEDATETVTETETEAATEAVTETETEAATEAVTETETEAATEAEPDTSVSAGDVRFVPGTYTASAAGISSDVTVTIVVDETSILSVGYDVSGETDTIGALIGPEISAQILEAQSADVDGVSGATITSDAFKTALEECITLAEEAVSAEADDLEADTEEEVSVESEDTDEASSSLSGYTAGTYTASAQGINGEITVTVTFDEENMIAIGYDLSGETESIGGAIGPEISGQILEAQSTDVDGVSGATITSNAVKEAIAACIAQAQSGDASTEDAEEESEDSDEIDAELTADALYVAGTYTAVAEGISSEITVTMTFDETSIVEMDADVSGETSGIGAIIDEDVINQVLTAQSTDVDGVSGATITSNAILEAAADCIAQAQIAE